MRLYLLFLPLAACSAIENSFTVEDAHGVVSAAELDFCGSTTPLHRVDGQFVGSVPIDCEGRGHVRLTYASGQKRECLVGYVTPGAKQDYLFRASDMECQYFPPIALVAPPVVELREPSMVRFKEIERACMAMCAS